MIRVRFALLSCSLCFGSDPSVQGPILSYFYDSGSASVRAVNGLPGSATVGARLATGIKKAAVSALGKVSLSCSEAGALAVSALGTDAPPVKLPGYDTCPESLILSPLGTSALARTGNSLTLLTGMQVGEAPRQLEPAPEGATTFAISDSGSTVYAAGRQAIWRRESTGAWSKLLSGERVTTPSFVPGSDTAVAAADGKLWEVDGNGEAHLIADVAGATAVLAAKDAHFVALGRRLLIFKRGGTTVEAEAPVQITELDHMDGHTVRLTSTGQTPIWAFVPASATFVFIPAAEPENE